MEQFSDLIKNRRSMRKFTGEEVNQEEVVTLLKAALMSPSSKRSNCWQFIAVDDKETLEKLSHCKETVSYTHLRAHETRLLSWQRLHWLS